MVTGESMPVAKAAGDRVIGGTINGTGALRDARRKSRRDTVLARIVADGRQGAAQPRADPAPRRSGRRAGSCPRSSPSRSSPSSPGGLGPAAAPRLRAGRRGLGADHRLSLRARAGDADVDHGRRRARRAVGRADQERRSAGAAGEGGHTGRRQDRHADRRQAARRRRRGRRRASTRTTCCASPRAWSGRANIRWRPRSSRRRRSAGSP